MERICRIAALILVLSACCHGGETGGAGLTDCVAAVRGVNLANALEAPREGEWGVVIEERYFDVIAGAGFNLVRVPVALAAHAQETAPYAVSGEFLSRIEEVLRWAEARGLKTVLALHSYEGIYQEPDAHADRFAALWEQMARLFAGRFSGCWFELLNEPHANLTAETWNSIMALAVERVRKADPGRVLVLGGVEWSDPLHLESLRIPAATAGIIGTFHYYRPYEFTNQGAPWNPDMERWRGREWTGSPDDMAVLKKDFAAASAWSARTGIPVLVGEFGAIRAADQDSRSRWTAAVRREAEARGFGWAYWDFSAAFALYDTKTDRFDTRIMQALGME
ncbi:MAG: glycoside hydrolase family 5 protein [Planctomycetaceae bacterium]|nr:glycoside hydrolase family 5 protein [Planctomycetaceae bacterium]